MHTRPRPARRSIPGALSGDQEAPPLPHTVRPPRLLWLSWLLGAAALAAVVAVALHLSEARDLKRLLQEAQPAWFALALLLQALTYLAQGQIYRQVVHAGGAILTLRSACRLGLVKLFVDQALPTYGLSGALAVTAAFERLAVPRPVVISCLVIGVSSYLLAYVFAIGVALGIVIVEGHATALLIVTATLFALGSLAVALGIALLAGRRLPRLAERSWIGRGLAMLRQVDPGLTRNPRLLARVVLLDLSIILLDGTTLWVLVRAMGEGAPWSGVFAGYMLASVLRSIGVTPGGLGVFEGAAVTTLHWAGVSLPVALSATLLFRGLSFWAPMLPGILVARRALLPPSSH
ncbi:flippase-like domain-containing protein [Pseudomonas sp. MAP12]|uniref:Flippase-like domain-containing protein n=1 Tax=Geopseudomonas aromaticivorans TaxID=2849492 RepID=A0ABS6MTY9_9GAMM|nr:lysylphosphatidylglycerol synthase transmembrane domain-containing protein [Pseudomonas aromaticivorans]MBV2132220.1 flippase-like domain-containing protein [Pseudomonas aromaticivorans]